MSAAQAKHPEVPYYALQPFLVGAMAVEREATEACLHLYIGSTPRDIWGTLFGCIHRGQIEISRGTVRENVAAPGEPDKWVLSCAPDASAFAQTRGTQAVLLEELAEIQSLTDLLRSRLDLGGVFTAPTLFKREELCRPIRELAKDLQAGRLRGIEAREEVIEALVAFVNQAQASYGASLGADQLKAMGQWLNVIERSLQATHSVRHDLLRRVAECRGRIPQEGRPASRGLDELSVTLPERVPTGTPPERSATPDTSASRPSPVSVGMSVFSPGPETPPSAGFIEPVDADSRAPATSTNPDPQEDWQMYVGV